MIFSRSGAISAVRPKHRDHGAELQERRPVGRGDAGKPEGAQPEQARTGRTACRQSAAAGCVPAGRRARRACRQSGGLAAPLNIDVAAMFRAAQYSELRCGSDVRRRASMWQRCSGQRSPAGIDVTAMFTGARGWGRGESAGGFCAAGRRKSGAADPRAQAAGAAGPASQDLTHGSEQVQCRVPSSCPLGA